MKNFEATILISPDLSSAKLKSTEANLEKNISEMGGSIIAKESWGLRDLSYSINNSKKAFYNFYQLNFEGAKIQELKKILSQNEEIMRYLFVRVNEHEQLPTKLSPDNNNEKER